jgi:hypothetical protein
MTEEKMAKTPDVPAEVATSLEQDAALYGHGVAELRGSKWVRLDPRKLVVLPYRNPKPDDSTGYFFPEEAQ